jgi:hypothetical protein
MRAVRVNIHINAPIKVFESISDHERFLSSADGTTTKLLQEDTADRGGLGCVRQVKVGRRAGMSKRLRLGKGQPTLSTLFARHQCRYRMKFLA